MHYINPLRTFLKPLCKPPIVTLVPNLEISYTLGSLVRRLCRFVPFVDVLDSTAFGFWACLGLAWGCWLLLVFGVGAAEFMVSAGLGFHKR